MTERKKEEKLCKKMQMQISVKRLEAVICKHASIMKLPFKLEKFLINGFMWHLWWRNCTLLQHSGMWPVQKEFNHNSSGGLREKRDLGGWVPIWLLDFKHCWGRRGNLGLRELKSLHADCSG